jgi:hypothetical protein
VTAVGVAASSVFTMVPSEQPLLRAAAVATARIAAPNRPLLRLKRSRVSGASAFIRAIIASPSLWMNPRLCTTARF